MDKQEYTQLVEAKNKAINLLTEEIKEATCVYLNKNKIHDLGDKLKVTSPKGNIEYGFVFNVALDWKNNIRYDLKAMKKDGTMSKNNLYVAYGSVVESTAK